MTVLSAYLSALHIRGLGLVMMARANFIIIIVIAIIIRRHRCHTCYRSVVCPLFFCMSTVILMHPAEAVGRNEMPFGRDTRVVSSNSVR